LNFFGGYMKKLLSIAIEHYSLISLIATFISFAYMFFFLNKPALNAFLLSFLTWGVGVRCLVAFAANWVPPFSDQIAEAYGWPLGSSFQREIASADAAFGLLGILCNWFAGEFWTATLFGVSCYWFLSELKGLLTIRKRQRDPTYSVKSSLHAGMGIDFVSSIVIFFCLIIRYFNVDFSF